MKKLLYIITAALALTTFWSCKDDGPIEAAFEDMERLTIYDYIVENDSLYSKFNQILVAGELDKTLDAYNPNGNDYTLFLPNNDAIDQFISQSQRFSSFDELIADKAYVKAMARYHAVNMGIITNEFPFGALPELNLSGQYLTIGFEVGEDSSYYKINNEAPLLEGNIEVSNGYVHVIAQALTPVTFSTYEWLAQNPNFSIFYEAVQATGFQEILSREVVLDTISEIPVTLLVEPDTLYNRYGIFSFDDLVQEISPDNSNYTDEYNQLNNFVGCHILEGGKFLSDFEQDLNNIEDDRRKALNYSTFGNVPLNINGEDDDLLINKGKVISDTIVSEENDTTYQYLEITFYYDRSNVLTQSGSVHLITNMLTPVKASRSEQNFEFFEEPLFNYYREEGGSFIVEDTSLLSVVSFTGGDDEIVFVKSDDETVTAWNQDYLLIQGEFSITYELPKIVQGSYDLTIRAHAFSTQNALVEVFFDGVKVGGLVDLTRGGSSGDQFADFPLGTVTLLSYETHTITVKSLIPGYFIWDLVRFEPV